MIRCPEECRLWPVDPYFQPSYDAHCEYGRVEARRRHLAVVSICRNAMPHLKNTLRLVEELAGCWQNCDYYVYENDSIDGTIEVLDDFAATRQWVAVRHETHHREDYRGFEADRTIALAEYRQACVEWVRSSCPRADYVMVLDTDPHGGFSIDGVMNSLGWICELLGESNCKRPVGCMASNSLFAREEMHGGKVQTGIASYDAYAARLNDWRDLRKHNWFHALLPAVGSPPIPMNSAFGGICLYRREAFLSLQYAGGDCEHVAAHRAMQRAGYQLYLNPGCRYIAVLP